jgi:hypothetical protein
MSKEVARWDKMSFLEAVREKFGEEFQDVSEKFIDRLSEDYDIMWSERTTKSTEPAFRAIGLPNRCPFLQYSAGNPDFTAESSGSSVGQSRMNIDQTILTGGSA